MISIPVPTPTLPLCSLFFKVQICFAIISIANYVLVRLDKPVLCFHTSFCDAQYKSKAAKQRTSQITWAEKELPALHPCINDVEFLARQHVLVTLRDKFPHNGKMVRGACVLPLRDFCAQETRPFDIPLELDTRIVGRLQGHVRMQAVF